MPLADIEKIFIDNLMNLHERESEFIEKLLPLEHINEEKQLSIYKSNVNGAVQKVLAQIYPACMNILGEDYFNQLCRAYRFQYPSTDPDLNNYGEYFSVFIKEQYNVHDELDGFEYLADLASLEWAWHAGFYAENDTSFAFDELAKVATSDQDKLVFTLSDSFSLHSSIYPVLDIWRANKGNVEEHQEFFLPENESYFCISRVEFSPDVSLLSNYQFEMLKYISNGLSLTQLTECHFTNSGDFQNELMNFIQKGWIIGFSLYELRDQVIDIQKGTGLV